MGKRTQDQATNNKFVSRNGVLDYQDRVFIPHESDLIPQLLQEIHISPLGGNSWIKATLTCLLASFYLPKMHSDVKDFDTKCSTCKYNKYENHSPHGLLWPLYIPNQVWEEILMDSITHLPLVANKITIRDVVDRLTNFSIHCYPNSNFCSFPGFHLLSRDLPPPWCTKTIVSDCDKLFISSYHPQTDGQTEVLNRCLETYMCCFVSEEPRLWPKYLPRE